MIQRLVCAVIGLHLAGLPLAAQRSAAREVFPVLDFPEAGIDDSASYRGYRTRFYRDSKGNTVQIYLDARSGRVVNLWADDANESIGFTVRAGGQPTALSWASASAVTSDSGRSRTISYRLTSDASRLEVGWFVLGSMRVERDFQYEQRHLRPFGEPGYQEGALVTMIADLAQLPEAERARHLALLGARDVEQLRARLAPAISATRSDSLATVRVTQPSFDARHQLVLELLFDGREASAQIVGPAVAVVSRNLAPVRLEVRLTTDADALTPLARGEIFDAAFLAFADSTRARDPRIERQLRAVELLSTREKLMAGLPNFATYFGRDQMMSALMMQSIWAPGMAEHVIGSVLRKLSPAGQVSHEEALGGQAIRESAAEYSTLLARHRTLAARGERRRADSALARARDVLGALDRVRENYAMIDDEFQLAVLASRYLRDPRLDARQKRAFLLGEEQGVSRLDLLLRELELVARSALPYARSPIPTNLVGFAKRDALRWHSGSWRDSGAGYANGRFAMDINAIWVPLALQSIGDVLVALNDLGLVRNAPATRNIGPLLRTYLRDPETLSRAVATWRGASKHFVVRVPLAQLRERLTAKLASLPAEERRYWDEILTSTKADSSGIEFLALSLDASGRPIGVANTDPATRLFLAEHGARGSDNAASRAEVLRDVAVIVRPYPVGLFVSGLGPVVANDTYASPAVWDAFRRDLYHSPQVVWGREVNLVVLGLANHLAAAFDEGGRLRDPALQPYVRTLAAALRRVQSAVEESGLRHNELWSYHIEGGRLLPVRYGSSSDVQLWNTTSLAVQFALSRLPKETTSGLGASRSR